MVVACNTVHTPSLAFLFRYKSDAKRAAIFALNNHHYVMKTLCAQVWHVMRVCVCKNVAFHVCAFDVVR